MSWYAKALAAVALTLVALGAGRASADTAVFAGGCFWCMEDAFEHVAGVSSVISGYTGGHVDHPTYRQVSSGGTGHYESVEVHYNPSRISYAGLLNVFWHNIDPFDARGQFCDHGSQYHSAIFVANDAERKLAEASKAKVVAQFHKSVTTRILARAKFWPAEAYHQNYYKTHSVKYHAYKYGCGRPQRLRQIWGKPGA